MTQNNSRSIRFEAKSHDFLRDAHAAAAHAGGLDLNLLLLAGEPIAYSYNYHYQGRVSVLEMKSAANLSTCEPATVLMKRMLADSCQRGDHTIDLGAGQSATKSNWQTSVETSYHYTHFPWQAVRAQALRLRRWMATRQQTLRSGV